MFPKHPDFIHGLSNVIGHLYTKKQWNKIGKYKLYLSAMSLTYRTNTITILVAKVKLSLGYVFPCYGEIPEVSVFLIEVPYAHGIIVIY